MLKKLLKYDLQNIYKVLVVFYILATFFAILTRIFLNIDNSFILNIVGQICSGITISMFVNILINNIMRLWVRIKNNFYGDESYLTHTLPIEKKTLYLSKNLAAIISLFSSILVIGLNLFIAYYSKENIQLIKNILLPLANIYDSTTIKIILAFLFVFFLEFINALQAGYTGIIIGHKMNNNKTSFSILFGFVTYLIIQLFLLLIVFLIGLFNKDIMNLFITNEIINVNVVKTLIYLVSIIYSVTFILVYFINVKIFNKGVNVD